MPLTRRGFLAAGGLALAGRLLPAAFQPSFTVRSSRPTGGPAGPVEIAMRTFGGGERVGFDPVGALVPPGGTVRWVLLEGVHTSTAFHPAQGEVPRRVPTATVGWDSGYLVEPGSTFEVVLREEGVYDYFCRPHLAAGMVGRIVVAAPDGGEPGATRSAPAGRWTPEGEGGVGLAEAAREALAALPSPEEILRRGAVPLPAPEDPP